MDKTTLALTQGGGSYSVVRLASGESIPDWAMRGELFSVTKTSDELSIVCESRFVPEGAKCESGFVCIKVLGPLDFSLTGILASLLTPLSENEISVFALSTFDTDYLLVKKEKFLATKDLLEKSGHCFKDISST